MQQPSSERFDFLRRGVEPNGEQSLGYSELIAPLIGAAQELADANHVLQARVGALEQRGQA